MGFEKFSLLHPEDKFKEIPGFDFTQNDFEDLIDNFTPIDDINVLLGVSPTDLDKFCKLCYNMNFKDTYDTLLRRANAYFRKAMFSLSKSGNPTAIKVAAEFYVGLGAVDKSEHKLVFVSNIPQDVKSDVEKLQDSQQQSKEILDKVKGDLNYGDRR